MDLYEIVQNVWNLEHQYQDYRWSSVFHTDGHELPMFCLLLSRMERVVFDLKRVYPDIDTATEGLLHCVPVDDMGICLRYSRGSFKGVYQWSKFPASYIQLGMVPDICVPAVHEMIAHLGKYYNWVDARGGRKIRLYHKVYHKDHSEMVPENMEL